MNTTEAKTGGSWAVSPSPWRATRLVHHLDNWLFAGYPALTADLAIYRILYACYLLCALPRATWLGGVHAAFFSPPLGFAALATGLPSHAWVVAVNILALLSASALLIGWKTPLASLATGCSLVVLNSWCYALAKINHDILVVVVPFTLAFSGWGNAYSIDARTEFPSKRENSSWSLALCCFAIGVAMFTGGYVKLVSGWLDPTLLCTYGHLVSMHFVSGRHTWLENILLQVDVPLFWKLLDWSVLVLELGFLAAVWRHRLFVAFCALATFFHLGVWLLFDIAFGPNLVGYGVIVPFSVLPITSAGKAGMGTMGKFFRKLPAWLLLMVVFGSMLSALFGWTRHPTGWLPLSLWEIVLTAALILSTGYFAKMGFAILGKKTAQLNTSLSQTRQAA